MPPTAGPKAVLAVQANMMSANVDAGFNGVDISVTDIVAAMSTIS